MMKYIFFPLLVLLFQPATAQVTLQATVPAVGLLQKNQLWNVLVINSSATAYDCRLELIVRDRMTGQEILTATTAPFSAGPGARSLNINTLSPVQYNYLTAGGDTRLEGLLAAGVYTACYTLSALPGKTDLAEECVQFDVEPLSPPMLIFPADSTQLETAPTQFSWIPPTPQGMFDRLHYEIIITEINEGQKAEEAIQQNLPYYSDGNVITNMLNYPGSSEGFTAGKWYAWQVIAKDDKSYAGKSETWVFRMVTKADEATPEGSFAEARSVYTGKKYYFTSAVNFSFINPYVARQLDYSIMHVATKTRIGRLPAVSMKQGLNTVSIDTKRIKGLKKNELYSLEIYNLGTATYYINFIIKE
jgi:hypothetical protein